LRQHFYEYCTKHKLYDLLMQWHPQKNLPLTPETISYGSNSKVWWLDQYGHEWQATPISRISGNGCPFCSGRFAISGKTDLVSTHPALASQWHPTKNGLLMPCDMKAGSGREVWWEDEKGHEWKARISARAAGNGCPICANRKILVGYNDLATTHPQYAAQLHPDQNGDITAEKITAGYGRKLWWRCEQGHEWYTSIASRIKNGAGCPICANKKALKGYNDLATTHPHIATQWHPEKNGSLTPYDVVAGGETYIWWQCEKGHAWRTKLKYRTRETASCPYCSGKKVLTGFNDLATVNPKVAAQWHPFLNGRLTPQMVTAGSSRVAWWLCDEGHVWRTAIANRALPGYKETQCPFCQKMTKRSRKQEYYRKIEMEARMNFDSHAKEDGILDENCQNKEKTIPR